MQTDLHRDALERMAQDPRAVHAVVADAAFMSRL